MRCLLLAMAAIVPLAMTGCGHSNRWLDATFCQPCNKGHLVGGCWNGQCGYGGEGCSDCVRGQGEEIMEGEMVHEGQQGYMGDEYAMGGECDCAECQTGRHGRGKRGGWGRGKGRNPYDANATFGGPGGMPTAQVAYPYYTTRAPRDFLNPNPRSIGR